MPLSFLLTLTTYLILSAATIRWPTIAATACLNVLTLAVLLFSTVMAVGGSTIARRRFYAGFALFFGGSYLLYYGNHQPMMLIGPADLLGEIVLSVVRSTSLEIQPIRPIDQMYVHVSQSFAASVFAILGGYVAMFTASRHTQQTVSVDSVA